jgi:hypothetical protein
MDNEQSKPKTIATIDVKVHMPKVSSKDWILESLDEHLHCVLCGTPLAFKHKTDFITQVVTEDAHCPHCRVRNRQSAHSLQ